MYSNMSSMRLNRRHRRFFLKDTPLKKLRGCTKKLMSGGTTRAYYQIIYRWTAHWLHPYKQEMPDNTQTDTRTDNMQFFVWHGSQNLCQTIKKDQADRKCPLITDKQMAILDCIPCQTVQTGEHQQMDRWVLPKVAPSFAVDRKAMFFT